MLTFLPELPRLLLVEADPAVSAALQRGLRRAGWDVLWAPQAGLALRIKPVFAPFIVLLSLSLPDMDGGALVSLLAQQDDCAVIAMSGRGEAVRQAVLDGGAHDYLPKPVTMRHILERLRAAPPRWASVPVDEAPRRAGEVPAWVGRMPSHAGRVSFRAGEMPARAGEMSAWAGKVPSRASKALSRAGEAAARTGGMLADAVLA